MTDGYLKSIYFQLIIISLQLGGITFLLLALVEK